MLQLDLATSNMKKGSFKLVTFGMSMLSIFNLKAEGTEAICAKCTYNSIERVVEVGGLLTKKTVDVPSVGFGSGSGEFSSTRPDPGS